MGETRTRGFLPVALSCLLMEDQIWCGYYQTFDLGKRIVWPCFRQFDRRAAPIFCTQLGQLNGASRSMDTNCGSGWRQAAPE